MTTLRIFSVTLTLALCFVFAIGTAETISKPDYKALLGSIESSYNVIDLQDAGERVFILAEQDGVYRVIINKREGSTWVHEVTSSPIRVQNNSDISFHLPVSGSSVFYLDCIDTPFPQPAGAERSSVQYSFRLMPDDTWQLSDYSAQWEYDANNVFDSTAFFYPYEVRISGSFSPGAEYSDHRIFGTLKRDLDDFDIAKIPLTHEDARKMLSTENLAMVNNASQDGLLDLRKEATYESLSLGQYYNGSFVTILEVVNDQWFKVDCLGVEGYMARNSLALSNQYDQVNMAYTQRFLESIQSEPLFLQPTEESEIVSYVQPNEELFEFGVCSNGWSHVQYKNIGGYIMTSLISE